MADLLILENDARIAELLGLFLTRRGHAVRAAATVDEARAMLGERRPDLLLSDIELGAENGRRFLPQLSAEGLLPPTLVVSGYVDAGLAGELKGTPEVLGVVAKPFEFAQLERRIAQALASGESSAAPVAVREGPPRGHA